MYLLVLYFYFISLIICFFFSSLLGSRGVALLTSFFSFLSLITSFFLFYEVGILKSITTVYLFSWIGVDTFVVNFSFEFDAVTVTMLIVINTVSFFTHLYSVEYMYGDMHQPRFMLLLTLFTLFMLVLVTSANLIQLFIGWEGVGICSFLLINFWYTRIRAVKSSLLAVFFNKVGDIALLIAFGVSFYMYSSFDFNVIKSCALTISNLNYLDYREFDFLNNLFCLFVVIGAIGKSAQVGLHVWLPEAMEGPTPVSSLIHAATMVTAGIFILIKISFLLVQSYSILVFVFFMGSFTSFFAASIALFQHDVKKIIAYSTSSQLGYMFFACGTTAFSYSLFHLMNHAFFKALLFLTAGYIIHTFSNEQDVRKMGGLIKLLPFPYILILVASLSLMAVPFFSGFYSKEKIVYLTFNVFVRSDWYNLIFLCQLFSYLTIFFTIFYSVKLLAYVFFDSYNGFRFYLLNIHYASYFTLIPLFILSLFSMTSGYLGSDLMLGSGSDFWNNSLFVSSDMLSTISNYNSFYVINFEFNHYIHLMSFVIVLYSILLYSFYFSFYRDFYFSFTFVYKYTYWLFLFLNRKYLIFNKVLYGIFIDYTYYYAKDIFYFFVDKRLIESIMQKGGFLSASFLGQYLRTYVFNYIYVYTSVILFFLILMLHILLY